MTLPGRAVVARELERKVEAIFHPDSYGYRPGRSALDAVATCRRRCWQTNWAIDLDIAKFFDSVPWDMMVKAVEADTDLPWVLLYVKRWLEAPLQLTDGSLQVRDRGTPQGSAISPILANLFLHYAFDTWLVREFPGVSFERYVDDAVVHCVSEGQARQVLSALSRRMAEVGLELHPDKTRIVYCKDSNRRGSYEHTAFTFLGYTFRPRGVRTTAPSFFCSVWFSCGLLDAVDGEGVGAVVEIAAGVGDVGTSREPDRAEREVAESGEISGCVTGSELR
ncbi:hypothetical protein F8271_29865 [Micromonospora sp. ALFpr18c]|nr:hypothetical protein F8271_29865 [Micromonospora sp. ALFpr18c]